MISNKSARRDERGRPFLTGTPESRRPYLPSIPSGLGENVPPLSGSRTEEAVQGAGMLGPLRAQGTAESDASVRPRVRSHVPGMKGDRAQAEEAGIRKAKPQIEIPSIGIRRWAVFKRGSAHEPPPENVGRERDAVGILGWRR
jgi:hypothetical protein